MPAWSDAAGQDESHHAGCCRRSIVIVSGSSIPIAKIQLGKAQAKERPMTVWISVDRSKPAGDPEHLKVFASEDAADRWFAENDQEGVAFKYEVEQ
jgi:hypothetical protein